VSVEAEMTTVLNPSIFDTEEQRRKSKDPRRHGSSEDEILARVMNQSAVLEVILIASTLNSGLRRVGFVLRSRNTLDNSIQVRSHTVLTASATIDGKSVAIPLTESGGLASDAQSSGVLREIGECRGPLRLRIDSNWKLEGAGDAQRIELTQFVSGLGTLMVELVLMDEESVGKIHLLDSVEPSLDEDHRLAPATRGMLCWRAKILNIQTDSCVLRHLTLMKGSTLMGNADNDALLLAKDQDTLKARRKQKILARLEFSAMVGLSGFILLLSGLMGKLDPKQTLGFLTPRGWLLAAGLGYYSIQRKGTDDATGLLSVMMLCLVGAYDDHSLLWVRVSLVILAVIDYAYRRFYRTRWVQPTGDRSALLNGWQSWSFSGCVLQGQPMPKPGLPDYFTKAFHDGAGSEFPTFSWEQAPREQSLVSDMYAVLCHRRLKNGMVAGFLSQREQYGVVTLDSEQEHMGIHCSCDEVVLSKGGSIQTDWATVMLMPRMPADPLREYMLLTGALNGARKYDLLDVHSGWCSWYHYMYDISERCIRSNLDHIVTKHKEYPVSLFQIDDGYEPHWGDWTVIKDAFPEGEVSLKKLAADIEHAQLMPGIWLAPFSTDKTSLLQQKHPTWILSDERGRPCNSANCGKFFYGLDITRKEVQEHARETIRRAVKEWNFRYLKLDFLYSAVLKGIRKNNTITRAQAMQIAFQLIREEAGESTYILGCGAPLGSALGWVNAMRVTADTGPTWKPEFPLPSIDNWNLPCARNMVRNTMTRSSMHARWWVNDPDCVLLREDTKLTYHEMLGIATVVAMSGAMTLISDDLLLVSENRMDIGKAFNPVTGRAAVALDLMDKQMPELLYLNMSSQWKSSIALNAWHLLAVCNWEDRAQPRNFELANILPSPSKDTFESGPLEVHVFEYWSRAYSRLRWNTTSSDRFGCRLHIAEVGAHSAKMFSVRPIVPKIEVDESGCAVVRHDAMYIGSDIHFTCGMEVVGWKQRGSEVKIQLFIGRTVKGGNIWVSLPGSSQNVDVQVSGSALHGDLNTPRNGRVEHVAHDVWRFEVQLDFAEPRELVIGWKQDATLRAA